MWFNFLFFILFYFSVARLSCNSNTFYFPSSLEICWRKTNLLCTRTETRTYSLCAIRLGWAMKIVDIVCVSLTIWNPDAYNKRANGYANGKKRGIKIESIVLWLLTYFFVVVVVAVVILHLILLRSFFVLCHLTSSPGKIYTSTCRIKSAPSDKHVSDECARWCRGNGASHNNISAQTNVSCFMLWS